MRLIDADALYLGKFVEPRTEWNQGWNDALDAATTQAPTIDAVPVVRCRYCSPDDCGGVKWDLEDIGVSMTLQRGKLIICNEYGDEAEIPIRHCPICGAKMDGEANV